jgi:hypothetical protein
MIRIDQVFERLVEACPSYRARWEALRAEPDFDAEVVYPNLGDFAHHVVELLERGETAELPALARELEALHVEGDDAVKEAATIGILEGIQNVASHGTVSLQPLEKELGSETKKWWDSLDAFWAGKVPYVGADVGGGGDEKG